MALQYHLRPWCLFSTKPFLYENLLSFRPFGTNLIEIWWECFWHLQKLTFLFSPQCINPSVSLLHIYVTENNQHFSRHRCAFPNPYSPYRLPQGRQERLSPARMSQSEVWRVFVRQNPACTSALGGCCPCEFAIKSQYWIGIEPMMPT